MDRKVVISFFLGFFMLLFAGALLPGVRLLAFAPFFVILFTRSSFIVSLWTVFICGLLVDILSAHVLGRTVLNYLLSCVFLYRQKRFFNDKPFSIAIYTVVISLVSTLLSYPLEAIFNKPIAFFKWGLLTDIIVMPIIDGIYAILWFFYPIALIEFVIRFLKKLFSKA